MTSLTPIHECNDREVEMMVGKAMCAYANFIQAVDVDWMRAVNGKSEENMKPRTLGQQLLIANYASEYEATLRCIRMLVVNSLYEIQEYVEERAQSMMNV